VRAGDLACAPWQLRAGRAKRHRPWCRKAGKDSNRKKRKWSERNWGYGGRSTDRAARSICVICVFCGSDSCCSPLGLGRAGLRFARSAITSSFPRPPRSGPAATGGRLGGWLWRVGAGCRGRGCFSRNCATTLGSSVRGHALRSSARGYARCNSLAPAWWQLPPGWIFGRHTFTRVAARPARRIKRLGACLGPLFAAQARKRER
jgi:hypothetical protein